MFALDAVVLSKAKVRDGTVVARLLTREYGRIRAFCDERKSRPLDVGQIIAAKIESKAGTNRVREYHAKGGVSFEGLPYRALDAALAYFALLDLLAPEGVPNARAWDDCVAAFPGLSDAASCERVAGLLRFRLTVSYGIAGAVKDPAVAALLARARAEGARLRDLDLDADSLAALRRHVDESVEGFIARA